MSSTAATASTSASTSSRARCARGDGTPAPGRCAAWRVGEGMAIGDDRHDPAARAFLPKPHLAATAKTADFTLSVGTAEFGNGTDDRRTPRSSPQALGTTPDRIA